MQTAIDEECLLEVSEHEGVLARMCKFKKIDGQPATFGAVGCNKNKLIGTFRVFEALRGELVRCGVFVFRQIHN